MRDFALLLLVYTVWLAMPLLALVPVIEGLLQWWADWRAEAAKSRVAPAARETVSPHLPR